MSALRVLVCGGRSFNDAMTLGSWLGGIHNKMGIAVIIEGGASGADTLARKFAEWQDIPVQTFPANWKKYGRFAGPIRNRQMIEEGKPDMVIAFSGGKGTANMVDQANLAGVKVVIATTVYPGPRLVPSPPQGNQP